MRKSPYSKNRKKRRLEYIREKNYLNSFMKKRYIIKISDSLHIDEQYKKFKEFAENCHKEYSKFKIKKYSIVYHPHVLLGDYFTENLTTWGVTYLKMKDS